MVFKNMKERYIMSPFQCLQTLLDISSPQYPLLFLMSFITELCLEDHRKNIGIPTVGPIGIHLMERVEIN